MKKLKQFLENERRAEDRSMRDNADQEMERQGKAPRARKGKKLLFARYRVWAEAAGLGTDEHPVHNLADLSAEQLRQCLDNVHKYFLMHPRLHVRHGGSNMGFVKPGMGPAPGACLEDEGFRYNGERVGRVVKC